MAFKINPPPVKSPFDALDFNVKQSRSGFGMSRGAHPGKDKTPSREWVEWILQAQAILETFVQSGTTAERPEKLFIGQTYYDTTIDRPVFVGASGEDWIVSELTTSGITSERPGRHYAGQTYFDTTLDMPIWVNAALDDWIDATGSSA